MNIRDEGFGPLLGSILRGGFDPFQTFVGGVGVALSLFVGVCLPLMLVGLYSLYRTAKEERKEQMQSKSV
jgi:hypothetical protein